MSKFWDAITKYNFCLYTHIVTGLYDYAHKLHMYSHSSAQLATSSVSVCLFSVNGATDNDVANTGGNTTFL